MQGRESWQALQARLAAARGAADRGDRDTALAEVAAALELDPDFLAAHELRDRLLAVAAPVAPVPAAADDRAPAPPVPDVSADGYARFQQRTMRRRLQNRVEAARDAIERGRLTDAAAALDEVIELDPKLPELFALTEAFDRLRRASAAHRGPWMAAAAVFACTVLGGPWLQDSSSLTSRQVMTAGVLLPMAVPKVTVSMEFTSTGMSGVQQAIEASDAKADVTPEPADVPPAPEPPAPARAPVELTGLSALTDAARGIPPSPEASADRRSLGEGGQPNEIAAPPSRSPALRPFEGLRVAPSHVEGREPQGTPSDRNSVESRGERLALHDLDESALIQRALQRYELAYEKLDAQPAQALTFGACDVRVSGDAATAMCQGSPRVWIFTLRRVGGDWTIDSARAER